MKPFTSKTLNSPEKKIQILIEEMLRMKQWHIMRTHGNLFQSGFPDIFATHKTYGHRWLEIKLPGFKGSKFTEAQLETFPKLCEHGSGVWILTSHHDNEYQKLFQPYNWYQYLKTYRL